MGLFFNRKQKVVINVTVQEPPKPKQIRMTEQQRKLLKEGAVMDCDGNIFRPETVWIPDEPWNKIYHAQDHCGGRQCGTPYPEFEAIRRGLQKCPCCIPPKWPQRWAAVAPCNPASPLDRVEGYTPDVELL